MTPDQDLPIYEPDERVTYSLEIVAKITGISSTTILLYQEQGLIDDSQFDDESLHTLRRIEHLRASCEANLTGLKLIMGLMDQVERLKLQLRQ